MSITPNQLQIWLSGREDEHLEFKEAKNNFHFETLVKYCAALANEGGGTIVLGVTDKRPRKVVGTSVFNEPGRTKAGIFDRLRLKVEAEAIEIDGKRVLAFIVPSRPLGMPIAFEGAYWMRSDENLVTMPPDHLRRIFDEAGPDFSAEICSSATLSDLDVKAIEEFRRRWHGKSKQDALLKLTHEQLLRDAELIYDHGITFAALILMGTREALGKHLAQAELIFEYRASDATGPANQREEFREGFLLYYDRLWALINLRNDKQHYQDGLFVLDVPTFNEGAVREAILNAVSHRDYRHAGSVFIRQFSRRIEIVSPGGFPQGISPENFIDRQLPRNRRVADALSRCGFVERSGQGANRIFESCIREGKDLPDFTNTDSWQVSLTLNGQVQDHRFIRFLERITQETQHTFDTHELLLLDLIHRDRPIPEVLRGSIPELVSLGIIDRIGVGRGTRYILSRRFHAALGERGGYTRRRGLDKKASKEILFRHLKEHSESGCPMSELQQVLPGQSRAQIKRYLMELKAENKIRLEGLRRWAKWYPADVSG